MREQILKENRTNFVFPVGYHEFHENEGMNYFFNRLFSMGYARYGDMVIAGERIKSIDEWKSERAKIADTAVEKDRLMNAAFYYRAAEAYTPWSDPDKLMLYNKFITYFYKAFEDHEIETIDIPYNNSYLPVMRIKHTPFNTTIGTRRSRDTPLNPKIGTRRSRDTPLNPKTGTRRSRDNTKNYYGTIILHAGYDGFKEELYSVMQFLSTYGYDVINFDVPWMGRTRTPEVQGFDYKWEKLIGVILNYFELEDVTIFGLSFGGWLALWAAAFEPRIKRVISSSVSFDVNQYVGWFAQLIARFARNNMREFANEQIMKQMESDPQMNWFFDHLMHVTSKSTPIEAADVLAQINEENLHSDLVTQDVLILTGKDDHLVPFKMHNLQVKALKNAASVTPMVFTNKVHGQNHCQIGNLGLALSIVVEWLENTGK